MRQVERFEQRIGNHGWHVKSGDVLKCVSKDLERDVGVDRACGWSVDGMSLCEAGEELSAVAVRSSCTGGDF